MRHSWKPPKQLENPKLTQYKAQNCAQWSHRPRNDTNASGTHMHAQYTQISTKTAAKVTEDVSITQSQVKSPNSPIGPENSRIGSADGLGNM